MQSLRELKPEDWRNIPCCLVQAMKMVIEQEELQEQIIKGINIRLEQVTSRCTSSTNRVDREIVRREESLRQELRASERELLDRMDMRHNEAMSMNE